MLSIRSRSRIQVAEGEHADDHRRQREQRHQEHRGADDPAERPGRRRRAAGRAADRGRSCAAEREDRDVVVEVAAVEVADLVDQPVEERVVVAAAERERRRAERVPDQFHQAVGAEPVRSLGDPPLDQPVGVQQQRPAVAELDRAGGPALPVVEPGRR